MLYPIRILRKMIFCLTYYAYSINLPSFSVVCEEVNLSAVCLVCTVKKGEGSPYSITERRVPELSPVLGRQPTSDLSHKPGGRLPLLSAVLSMGQQCQKQHQQSRIGSAQRCTFHLSRLPMDIQCDSHATEAAAPTTTVQQLTFLTHPVCP